MAEVQTTLTARLIARPHNKKDTCKALGLSKIGKTVVKPANPAILGMINTVSHLVTSEEVK